MVQSILKKKIVWLITILLLFFIWHQLPSYAPCSSFSNFGSYEKDKVCIIPNNLTLEGNFDGLPKSLHVKGNLEIRGTSISNLPSQFRVDGNVFLYKTSIGKIPPNSYIGGDFDYYLGFGSPTIYCDEIPSKVIIKGNIYCDQGGE